MTCIVLEQAMGLALVSLGMLPRWATSSGQNGPMDGKLLPLNDDFAISVIRLHKQL